MSTRRAAGPAPPGHVRVIGGRLRGSKLGVPVVPGLRPTPQRLRQTLFDWLAPVIHGARVLDAFAGSSALGIEALSRGAAHVLFVERDRAQAEAVEADLRRLHQANATVRCADALQLFSHDAAERFDIVLLDPPFEAGAWQRAVDLLAAHGWLAQPAWVYVEAATAAAIAPPRGWRLHRQTRAGAVWGTLYHAAEPGGGWPER